MKLYWIKTNSLIKKMFSNFTWDLPNTDNKIYLTFDDGPTPEITDWVINQLQKYNAKATFFCIGKNIEKYPEIFTKIIIDGHSIGNHTFNHLNGWKNSTEEYIENVNLCRLQMADYRWQMAKQNLQPAICKLFRPPYGKLKASQSKKIHQLGYKIIMWDVLSADFDRTISPEKCLENVLKNTVSGSVIIFHDSVNAFPNLEYALPKTLKYLSEKGFIFEKII